MTDVREVSVLTSVRFTLESLEKVKAVAFVHGESNADIIRQAVDEFTSRHLADPEFRKKFEKRKQENNEAIERLLGITDPPSG